MRPTPPRCGSRATAGRSVFENVRFGYDGDAAILDGVTLDIRAGSKVALVGPSGAGKTTIFNLLLRFYECGSGHIAIDGHDIKGVTLESLRAAIGVVTQEATLFDESVADNIALGRPGAREDEIEQAARMPPRTTLSAKCRKATGRGWAKAD